MILRRVSLLLTLIFVASACGGGATGITPPSPTPTPTPTPGGTGTVTGTVAVAPTAALGPAPPFPARSEARRPATLPVYVPDRLLVKFRPGLQVAAMTGLHGEVGGVVVSTIERLGVQVVRLAPATSSERALRAYRASTLVEYAEQDSYVYKTATPTDPFYSLQWHYPAINLPTAWDIVTGSAGLIVAVIDTGIRTAHPDLASITVQGYDFFATPDDTDPTDPGCPTVDDTDPSHGMHVAGTVAAMTNNNVGVAGVNWGGAAGTKIMPIRVLGEDVAGGRCGTGFTSDVAAGIIYAADHGAKVINLSLGGPGASTTLENAVNYAYGLGVVLVAAAGNDNIDIGTSPFYPASYSNVITVAATACDNTKAPYSNYGSPIDIAAPGGSSTVDCPGGIVGERVLSTSWSPRAGYGYWYFSGTSMATPHVAGVLALMIARGITGPAALQATLQNTATDRGAPGWDPYFGWGLVNAATAVSGGATDTRMRAFSGVIVGSAITRQSNIVNVADNGAFTITNAQTGTKSVFIWQDFNANGQVDTGDYYGRVGNVVINPGATTNIGAVTVQRYTGTPITVAGIPLPVAGVPLPVTGRGH